MSHNGTFRQSMGASGKRARMFFAMAVGMAAWATAPVAQEARTAAEIAEGQRLPSVWDLPLGAHWTELPVADYIDFACGTNGGPPSLPLKGWGGFKQCPPQPGTDLHEVYFEYDDEQEYIGRARRNDLLVMRYEHTWVNRIPVIASALFDADGFFVGLRLVTDPRVDTDLRSKGTVLGATIISRYGEEGWSCEDLPPQKGESEYQGNLIKRHCTRTATTSDGLEIEIVVDLRNLRREGQTTIGWDNVPTEGEFESSTRAEIMLTEPIADRAARLAEVEREGPPEPNPDVQKALDCPGCDLRGADLKRADLTGANLAGADLSGANLHAATLANANLTGANLSKANINRADLRRTNLSGADLSGAMLFASRLDGADLSGANVNGALAGEIRLSRANLSGASVRAVDLRDSRLQDTDFSGADLTGSWLHNAQVIRGNFSEAVLIYLVALNANFSNSVFTGADLRGADLFGASFREADMTSADLSFTRLRSANLFLAKLEGTKFEGADLPAGFDRPNR